jgi:hypothetical protein
MHTPEWRKQEAQPSNEAHLSPYPAPQWKNHFRDKHGMAMDGLRDIVSCLKIDPSALVQQQLSDCLIAVVTGDVQRGEAALRGHIGIVLILL